MILSQDLIPFKSAPMVSFVCSASCSVTKDNLCYIELEKPNMLKYRLFEQVVVVFNLGKNILID